jgi:hypothetical protein
MQLLASLFVGKPLHILTVALFLLAAALAVRYSTWGAGRATGLLLIASGAWALYAAWEWLVIWRTPEADIRVDLLLLWPVLAILTAWAVISVLRKPGRKSINAGRS